MNSTPTPVINFFTESNEFVLRDKRKVREWLMKNVETEKKKIGELNYIFCSDRYLRKINKEYLQHDYFTDIITFPSSEKNNRIISGEIFISIDRVRDNAKTYRVSVRNELSRVIAHGLLHLCGYGDKTDKEVKKMREMENKWMLRNS